MKKIDSYIDDTIENIKNDRALALKLLTDVMKSLTTGHDHKDLGQVASKYLETLQRSNEQLVKVTSLIYKKDTTKFAGLSSEDKDEIFDLIQSGD
tara:strand:+ start:176 stop:460 length:285 start_codon:yes stop_codon:yes gene_type:complete